MRAAGSAGGARGASGGGLADVMQLKEELSLLRGELEGARRDVAQADALNRSLRRQVQQQGERTGAGATMRHSAVPAGEEERRDTMRMATPETTYLQQEVIEARGKLRVAEKALARVTEERDELDRRVKALELQAAPTRSAPPLPEHLADAASRDTGEYGSLSVHDLVTRDNVMHDALGRVEEMRAELTELEKERDHFKRQVELLTSENVSLRSINQLHTSPTGEFTSVSEALEVRGGVMERVIDALMKRKDVRGVALADPIGLPVVEKGSFTEEIAAVAAHITKLSNKTIRLLPFGALRSISLQDENALTVTIHPFITLEKSQLILATLTTGKLLAREDLEKVIAWAEAEG